MSEVGMKIMGTTGKGRIEPHHNREELLHRLAVIIAHCALLQRQPTPEEENFVTDLHMLFGDDGIKAAGMMAKRIVGLEGV